MEDILKPKALIIDSDADFMKECTGYLEDWGYKTFTASSHLNALTLVDDLILELLLVGMEGTDVDGLELCRLVRSREQKLNQPHTYILLLGQQNHRSEIIESDTEADDFIIRPFLPAELKWRVNTGFKKVRRFSHLQSLLQVDPGSNALNERGFYLSLQNKVNRIIRQQSCISLLILHINGMQMLEVAYGSDSSRWLVNYLIENINRKLRSYDKLAKLQWDRICLLLPDADFESLHGLISRLENEFGHFLKTSPHTQAAELELVMQGLSLDFDLDSRKYGFAVEKIWKWLQDNLHSGASEKIALKGTLTDQGLSIE